MNKWYIPQNTASPSRLDHFFFFLETDFVFGMGRAPFLAMPHKSLSPAASAMAMAAIFSCSHPRASAATESESFHVTIGQAKTMHSQWCQVAKSCPTSLQLETRRHRQRCKNNKAAWAPTLCFLSLVASSFSSAVCFFLPGLPMADCMVLSAE